MHEQLCSGRGGRRLISKFWPEPSYVSTLCVQAVEALVRLGAKVYMSKTLLVCAIKNQNELTYINFGHEVYIVLCFQV